MKRTGYPFVAVVNIVACVLQATLAFTRFTEGNVFNAVLHAIAALLMAFSAYGFTIAYRKGR